MNQVPSFFLELCWRVACHFIKERPVRAGPKYMTHTTHKKNSDLPHGAYHKNDIAKHHSVNNSGKQPIKELLKFRSSSHPPETTFIISYEVEQNWNARPCLIKHTGVEVPRSQEAEVVLNYSKVFIPTSRQTDK
jgi:hypothetical protein